jgi:hypothetical protein
MPNLRLSVRDLEILRTLARLRYVTGRQLRARFFSYDDFGRKRLKRLSSQDLIRPHTKGLPQCGYSAWRLTSRGIDIVAREFTDEALPDGLVERLAEGSLYNIEHREAINDLYLALVYPPGIEDVVQVRRAADQIRWAADGDVVLTRQRIGREERIIPDGTIESAARKALVYLEIDRSTKGLHRIERNLELYRDCLADTDAELVYVVGSEQRRASIASIAKRKLGSLSRWEVLHHDHAALWLAQRLLDPAVTVAELPAVQATPSPATLEASPAVARLAELQVCGREVIEWANEFLHELEGRGVLRTLFLEQPALLERGRTRLTALRSSLPKIKEASDA